MPKVDGGRVTASFNAETGTRYTIAATRGKTTKKGTCAVRGQQDNCVVRLGIGRWTLVVTPTRGGVSGKAAKRTISVR
jgi:hypothetical protein